MNNSGCAVTRIPLPRENEYKIEHYRRIQYANDHFHAGIPGWKTDRGRIYILCGPTDRKESHPAGGWYQRKAHEGGGSTSTFPFEIWEYRHIEGVGSEIELEFVDPSASNLYRLTLDPQEKDEFLHVPGMGLTFREMVDPAFEGQKSRDRVLGLRSQGLMEHAEIVERAKDHPFQKQELMLNIGNASAIRYDDLKEMVSTAITYGELPFDVLTSFVRIDADDSLVALTVVLDNSSSREPALEVSYALTPRDGEPASYRAMRSGLGRASDRLYIARLVQLGELEAGRYDLVCKILDRLKDESIVVREPFEVR